MAAAQDVGLRAERDDTMASSVERAGERADVQLRAVVRARCSGDGASVRPTMRSLCADARRRHAPVAQLVIALYDAWRASPEVQSLPQPEAWALLDELVSSCVEEYYDDADSA